MKSYSTKVNNTIDSEKKILRNKILQARQSLSISKRARDSRRIIEKILTNSIFTNAQNIFCYLSLDDEVSTHDFIKDASKNKRIFLPRICDGVMVPTLYTGHENLVLGKFGILEPQCANMPLVYPEIDMAIVPGVAFDRAGNRLGMGKGFYDRFLKSYKFDSPIITVALAFDIQVVDKVPTDDYDVPVSFLVTPNEFFTCKPITLNR